MTKVLKSIKSQQLVFLITFIITFVFAFPLFRTIFSDWEHLKQGLFGF